MPGPPLGADGPEPVTGELVSCPPDYRLGALSLAVEFYAGRHAGEAEILHAADEFYARLTAWPPGVPPGDAAGIRTELATITTKLEIIMTALDNLAAADAALKSEVATAIADWAAQLAGSSAANDPAIQAVADDMQAQVAALQAADTAVPPATPPSTSN
jgi:hypothetical protein